MRVFGQIVDQLDLIRLVFFLHIFDGFLARQLEALELQLFLADLIMMINNSNSTLKKDINLTAFELYNKHYGAIEKILKTTDEWKKSITTADKELEIKGFFTDPDYKLSEGTEAILRKILQEGFDENADSIKKN